jgi:excisionase family DNA binding protein
MSTLTTLDRRGEYLTVADVAAELGCSEPTVRRRIRDGSIPAVKLGSGRNNALRVSRSGLESWLWSGPGEAA